MTPLQITLLVIILFIIIAVGHAWITNKWGEKLREWKERKEKQKQKSKSG